MRFIFVRHAQSENNARNSNDNSTFNSRQSDPGLTTLGKAQATYTALYLRDAIQNKRMIGSPQVKYLFSSAMRRALMSSQPFSTIFGLPVHIVKDLFEAGGLYITKSPDERLTGLNATELKTQFPFAIVPDEIKNEGWYSGPYETESQIEVRARHLMDWMLSLAAMENDCQKAAGVPEPCAIVIVHGMMNHVVLNILNNQKLSHASIMNMYYPLANMSITQVQIKPHLPKNGPIVLLKTYASRAHHVITCRSVGVTPLKCIRQAMVEDSDEELPLKLDVSIAVISHNEHSHMFDGWRRHQLLKDFERAVEECWPGEEERQAIEHILGSDERSNIYSGQGIGIFKI